MRTSSGFNQFERETCTVTVGGVTMTAKAYKEMKKKEKSANQTKKRKARYQKLIQQISPYVKGIVKHVKVLKSAAAYYDNGYRQWGTKCRDHVIQHPIISGPFIRYRMAAYDIDALLSTIDKLGKKNEKEVFQFIEKLSYKIDDAKTHLTDLVVAVKDSRVCDFFKDEKFINETGRRLGLSILMYNALVSMSEIENLYKELNEISRKGVDVMDYAI